jgi:tetratricopeptide (TPR) repeat protein
MSHDVAPEVGARIGHYQLERRIGAGGMGEVYLATDANLNRRVAIKFLAAPADPQARRRLLREARAIAALDHPGICSVYEVGSDPDGGDFIVMQYVEGETLAARLVRGRMPAHEALGIAGHIAAALIAAHKRGLVHRDLKPQNIIITATGAPKLLDFGLATLVANTEAAANAMTTSQVTGDDDVVGTPAYMAPEQVRNEPADFRSDLFALGCVLYECLTGRRAFSGATTGELFGQILHVDPPLPSAVVSSLDPAYDAICARLLHKAPGERFQSAEEVVGAIRALTPSTQFGTATVSYDEPRPFLRRRTWIGVAMVLAAAGAIGLWMFEYSRSLPTPPADALRWYERGVEDMREGTYSSARSAFGEALTLFPTYVQARARLAEANDALGDERRAKDELLKVHQLVPNASHLDVDNRLRLDGAEALILREYDRAIDNYRKLADRHPNEAGVWLDVGRAEEAAGREKRDAARTDYAKAVALDGQYAAAHVRLGVLQAQAQEAQGLKSIDEAIRLFKAASNLEGEMEASLRKGIALSSLGKLDDARRNLEQVIQMAAGAQFVSQRVRAQFELCRVNTLTGLFAEAETLARTAVADAISADLRPIAASGLIPLGQNLMVQKRMEDANAQLEQAITLAADAGAKRTEMRARLQQASLRLQTGDYEDALKLSEVPLRYFSEGHDTRAENTAKNIAASAQTSLGHYDEAKRLTLEVATSAERTHDDAIASQALDNLAALATKLGQLPEALQYQERVEQLDQKTPARFAVDRTNHARLLIVLGRAAEAEGLLADVEREITAGAQAYASRAPVAATLRALAATMSLRFGDVGTHAAKGGVVKSANGRTSEPTEAQLLSRVLGEHALAQLGLSRVSTAAIARWPAETSDAFLQRETSYWVAVTLLARGAPALAFTVANDALTTMGPQGNPELGWRLAAAAAVAARNTKESAVAAGLTARVQTDIKQIEATWAAAAGVYFSRADLAALRRQVR